MSLANLLSISTASITRVVPTKDSAGGQVRPYTTAGRGSLPTTSTGRLQPISAFRRTAFANRDQETDAEWFTVTNPQCDNRDQITVGGVIYFVQSQRNPDLVNKFYVLELKQYTLNKQ